MCAHRTAIARAPMRWSWLQVEKFAAKCPGKDVGLRFNPGVGSGGTGKTNVGGPSSSFGIWHELADQASARDNNYFCCCNAHFLTWSLAHLNSLASTGAAAATHVLIWLTDSPLVYPRCSARKSLRKQVARSYVYTLTSGPVLTLRCRSHPAQTSKALLDCKGRIDCLPFRICIIWFFSPSECLPDQVWRRCTSLSIALCEKFPDVVTLNLGGGYKVCRKSLLWPEDLHGSIKTGYIACLFVSRGRRTCHYAVTGS